MKSLRFGLIPLLVSVWVIPQLSACSPARNSLIAPGVPSATNAAAAEDEAGAGGNVNESAVSSTAGKATVLEGLGLVALRQGPSTDLPVVAQLAEGVMVEVVGATDAYDWLQVRVDGREFWAYAALLRYSGDLSSIPVIDTAPTPSTVSPGFDLEAATELVRLITGEETNYLQLQGKSAMPNAGLREGWRLMDALGRTVWIDTESNLLIQIEPSPLNISSFEEPRSTTELREVAVSLASEHSTRFEVLRNELYFSEGAKSERSFFFQWEHPDSSLGSVPRMLQVGLTGQGEFLSWLNTLDLDE